MCVKYRSTTFICGNCGKRHTFYGKEADDIIRINDVLCDLLNNEYWDKNFSNIGIMNLLTTKAKCCANPKYLQWDRPIKED